MRITLKIFGSLTDIMGSDQFTVIDMKDTDQLVRHLKELHPELDKMKFTVAVDKKIIGENTPLSANSIVAILPPFSGG